MKWFRFYNDALTDPKVQSLPPELFKRWINILCIASKNGGNLPPNHALSTLLEGRSDHVKRHIKALVKAGLLDTTQTGYTPHNWLKFQYKSDNSTARVRAFRNGRMTVTETLHETPPETDTEAEKKEREREAFRGERMPAHWKPNSDHLMLADRLGVDVELEAGKLRDWADANGQFQANWDARFSLWLKNSRKQNGAVNGKTTDPRQGKFAAALGKLRSSIEAEGNRPEGNGDSTRLLPHRGGQ